MTAKLALKLGGEHTSSFSSDAPRQSCPELLVEGLGLRVEGLRFRVEGLRLRVKGLVFRVKG